MFTGCVAAVVGAGAGAYAKKYVDKNGKVPVQPAVEPSAASDSTEESASAVSVSSTSSDIIKTGPVFEGEASSKEDACLAANISANFEPAFKGDFKCDCSKSILWLCKVYPAPISN